MSYSFSIRASNKHAAISLIDAELAKVVESQPMHATDRIKAMAVAESFLDLVELGEGQDYHVSMNGSIGISTTAVVSASVGVTVTAMAANLT